MNVLHLSSDWKWTGPAAPMLELLLAQRARGLHADLACPTPPSGASTSLAERARAAGVPPVLELARGRAALGPGTGRDARRLRALLERADYAVVHTWHTRDHALALRAAGPRRRAGRTRVVRSWRSAEAIPPRPWNRWLFGPGTDGLLCVSPRAARRNAALRGGRPLAGAFGAVDVERFAPRPCDAALQAALGLRPEHAVVAIAARVQPQRRFDLLLAAAVRLAARRPDFRLLVLGRGTRRAALAERPAAALGLADRVVFAGHRGDDYPDALRLADVFTLLVPGSDGGCRALCEAAACGIPAVTTRRGVLPELVADGETGLLVDERADALAAGWQTLLDDPARRAALGAAARRRAQTRFAAGRAAEAVEALYRTAAAAASGSPISSR